MRFISSARLGFIACLLAGGLAPTARANVYATNLRINGGYSNVLISAGSPLGISYLLNESASAGVSVTIQAGTNILREISGTTARGSNYVSWDGLDTNGNAIAVGQYTIHVTARSDGFVNWRQISQDFDAANYAYSPVGIAVNRNPGSPYYGRVYVANGMANPNSDFLPGDKLGLLKANADGSEVADGTFSDGGWAWRGTNRSPWKIETAGDDAVYVNDASEHGLLLRFDATLSAASRALVLRPDNYPSTAYLGGPAFTGASNELQVWMADLTPAPNGSGIRRYPVGGNGLVATNEPGALVVATGGGSVIQQAPYDVAVDASNRVYTVQFVTGVTNPTPRVFRLSNYTNGVSTVTNGDWQLGANDESFRGAQGIAVNPAGTHVAVAFAGVGEGVTFSRVDANVKVFNTENGSTLTTIAPAPYHEATDVAWDAVGNLYVCDAWDALWRVYSPPGANESTTVALATVQVGEAAIAPVLSAAAYVGGQFQCTLTGEPDATYVLLVSSNLLTWNPVLTNTAATAVRQLSVPATGTANFYRAVLMP